ncbi:hypothetical protein QBC43DRAFT_285088 [Cladorrhinum sp. PSN259]|nr:hypothetical protein QBC43DRAFT_285088 [Cladorrhinum sp. PSN259]
MVVATSDPLPPSQTGCVTATTPLLVADTISAAQSLASYCAKLGPVTEWTKLSWVHNRSRVYMCNYNWWRWDSCGYDEIWAAWLAIQERCGLATGGWIFYPEWDRTKIGGKTIGFDDKANKWCSNL